MTFEDDIQRRFDSAQSAIQLEPGSTDLIRARAARHQRNRSLVAAAAALVLIIGVGSILLRIPDRPEPIDVEVASGSTAASDSRVTAADFTYLGGFKLPAGDWGDSRFAFGGHAAAFYADGDPTSDDGFDGSLFVSGHPTRNPGVAEVAIPAPMLHDQRSDDLPIAAVLRPFVDLTNGRALSFVGSADAGGSGQPGSYRYSGLEVIETEIGPRLAWTTWQYQNASANIVPGHGHSSIDLRDPDPQGPWFLDEHDSRGTAGYLFEVPEEFAAQSLQGNRLITGLQDRTASAETSAGPPFVAFTAPVGVESGTEIDALPLAFYDGEAQRLAGFGQADTAAGAEWITTTGGNQAVITVGHRGLGEAHNGAPRENDCGSSSGLHAGPYEPQILFYDPNDFTRLATGELESWQLEPYLAWNPAEFLVPTCEWKLSSVSFDEASGLLYVVQVEADVSQSQFSPVPVVHVFRL